MAYPTLPIYRQSKPQRISGRAIDRSVSGAARGRDFYGADKSVFTVEHRALSATDRSTLASFYNSNRNTTFSFTWPSPSATYTVMFDVDGYQEQPSDAYACYDVTVKLIEA
jgi:hypothetical protein